MKKINFLLTLTSVFFCLTYVIIYFIHKNYSMTISSISALFLPFVPYIINKLFNKQLPKDLILIYQLHIFFGLILGSIVDFYDTVTGYDKIIHFLSGILISVLSLHILKYIYGCNKKYIIVSITFIILFNVSVSGLWEIGEYIYDLLFHSNAQRGLTDTMQDIISALLGSLLFVILYIDKIKLK